MYYENDMFVDTETTGTIDEPIVYDFGAECLSGQQTMNKVIYETFFKMPELMKQAYYANKIPQYEEDIWQSKRFVEDFFELRNQIRQMFYNGTIKRVFAHNASFDVRALNNTCRVLSDGKIRYFFPYGMEICDTLKMAHQVLGHDDEYVSWCKENDYMTKHDTPRPRLTAEIIYRYITKDHTFNEEHTGLADVKIEKQIYEYLYNINPNSNATLYPRKA